jgi:hypothetical protein
MPAAHFAPNRTPGAKSAARYRIEATSPSNASKLQGWASVVCGVAHASLRSA